MVGGLNSYLSGRFSSIGMASAFGASATSRLLGYGAAGKQAQSLVESFRADNRRVQSLKEDSAQFLDSYTKGMKTMGAAADKVRGTGLQSLLYTKEGNVTENTVKKTVSAVKNMVQEYNTNVKTLNDNAGRGSGVVRQISRMVDDPAPLSSMQMVGLTVEKDGSLVLDEEKLTTALTDETPGQRRLAEEILGGGSGIAQGIKKDAEAGARASAASLIENDLAEMKSIRADNSIRTMFAYTRQGAYSMNNLAAAGMLMNFTV